jgi:hypothetical protein
MIARSIFVLIEYVLLQWCAASRARMLLFSVSTYKKSWKKFRKKKTNQNQWLEALNINFFNTFPLTGDTVGCLIMSKNVSLWRSSFNDLCQVLVSDLKCTALNQIPYVEVANTTKHFGKKNKKLSFLCKNNSRHCCLRLQNSSIFVLHISYVSILRANLLVKMPLYAVYSKIDWLVYCC